MPYDDQLVGQAYIEKAAILLLGIVPPFAVLPAPKSAPLIVTIATALFLIAHALGRTGKRFEPVRKTSRVIVFPMIGLAALASISAVWSPDPLFSFSRALQLAGAFLVATTLFAFMPKGAAPRIATLLAISSPIAMLIIGLDAFFGFPLLVVGQMKPAFFEYNRALFHLACFSVVVLSVPLSAPLRLAAVGVLLAILVVTESQATQVGLICGLLIAAIAKFSSQAARLLTILGLVALVILAPIAISPLSAWVGDIVGSSLPTGAAARIEIWAHLGEQIPKAFPLGVGFEASRFGPEIGEVHLLNGVRQVLGAPHHPHNFALQAYYELGVTGSLLIAATGIAVILNLKDWPTQAQVPALLSYNLIFVSACFANSAWQAWRIALIAIVLVLLFDASRQNRPVSG